MAFKVETTQQVAFDSVELMMAHVELEKKNTARISVTGLLSEGAEFRDDECFGKGDYALKFNSSALDDLCRLLNLYSPMLEQLERPGLASEVLNDRIHSKALQDKLNNTEFVFDEPSKTILGVVSKSYVGYSNLDFLNDVCACLSIDKQKSWLPTFGEFEFSTSYSINTHLNLRLQNKSRQGVVRGKGGIAEDVSFLGLQISNSMAGGKALRMAYFVERMVCANGLILPVGGSQARLIHAGHRKNFNRRLSEKMADVVGSLGIVKKTIEQLGDIDFNAEKLASHVDLKTLFDIIPGKDLRKLGTDNLSKNFKDWLNQFEKEERERQRNIKLIADIPDLIGGEHSDRVFKSGYRDGATMFDFINVFTEEAHKYEPEQRLQIEKNTGGLADFIANNKKKFA